MTAIPPGAKIGILGGGQLGRMTALAAAALGYKCHIFSPDKDAPAAHVADAATVAAYTDEKALAKFASQVAVVTYEFENIPYLPVAAIAERVPVRPSPTVLQIAQDRLREKEFLNSVGAGTAKYRPVSNLADLMAGVEEIGRPAALKTARLGYGGTGHVAMPPHPAPAHPVSNLL